MPDSFHQPASDAQWEALLRQLRQQSKAQPRPFFYARVHTRLLAQASAPSAWWPAWLRRPAYAALLAAMVIAISGDGSATAAGRGDQASRYPAHYSPR